MLKNNLWMSHLNLSNSIFRARLFKSNCMLFLLLTVNFFTRIYQNHNFGPLEFHYKNLCCFAIVQFLDDKLTVRTAKWYSVVQAGPGRLVHL